MKSEGPAGKKFAMQLARWISEKETFKRLVPGSKSTSHQVGRDEISVLRSNNSTAYAAKDIHQSKQLVFTKRCFFLCDTNFLISWMQLFIRITYKKHCFHYLISRSSACVRLSTDLQIYASFEEAIRKYPVLHNQYTVSMC